MTQKWWWKYYERPRRIITSKIFDILGWKNPEIIQWEVNRHRNELVWHGPFEVVKLLGWTDQYEDDYYYVVAKWPAGIQLISCVGGFTWLKKRMPIWRYKYEDEIFTLNIPQKWIDEQIKEKGIILK